MTKKSFSYRGHETTCWYSSLNKIFHVQMIGASSRFHFKTYLGRITRRALFRDALRQCFYGLMASDFSSYSSPRSVLVVLDESLLRPVASHSHPLFPSKNKVSVITQQSEVCHAG